MAEADRIDDRPAIEPEFFGYRALPDDPDEIQGMCREVAETLGKGGATFFRFTLVNRAFPNPPYPDGLYVEGWTIDPARMSPSGQQAPFEYPLVAIDQDSPPT